MVKYWYHLIFFCFVVLANSCVELYQQPDVVSSDKNLVVEGFLNYGDTTTITLSYTKGLKTNDFDFEKKAVVEIQNQDNISFLLLNMGNGVYKALLDNLKITDQYRLSIKTEGDKFISDYVSIKLSPDIDSITWVAEPKRVNFSITTHDNLNSTRYYRWSYFETWEYHSAFPSCCEYDPSNPNELKDRTPENQIYACWKNRSSKDIFIGSSIKLSDDVIFKNTLGSIHYTEYEFSFKYSMLVKQQALSREAFEYWNDVKKNSEDTGTLFSPQPSQVASNIHSLNNSKPVIGFFYASTVTSKRIFIDRKSIPFRDVPRIYCEPIFTNLAPAGFVDDNYIAFDKLIGVNIFEGSTKGCMDCRLQGGKTKRPDYWE